jgi:hypothetical protein
MEPLVFERITRINYMGYYLCAKYASRIMQKQYEQNPGLLWILFKLTASQGY